MKEQRERRIMILLRLSLLAIGATLGSLAMWQMLDVMAMSFHVTIEVLFYFAAVVVLGGVLFLSAPMVRLCFSRIAAFVRRKKQKSTKAVDVAGIALGLLAGIVAALLVEFTFVLFLPILAVRIFIAVVVGILLAFVVAVVISNWVAKGGSDWGSSIEESAHTAKGFLITELALAHPKIINLCKFWLEGNLYVLTHTAERLARYVEAELEQNKAYENFTMLYQTQSIKILDYVPKSIAINHAYIEAAEFKKLKIVSVAAETELLKMKRDAIVLVIEDL